MLSCGVSIGVELNGGPQSFNRMLPGTRRTLAAIVFGTIAVAYVCSILDGQLRLDTAGRWSLTWGALFAAVSVVYVRWFTFDRYEVVKACYLLFALPLLGAMLWTSRVRGEIAVCAYPLVGIAIASQPRAVGIAATAAIYGMIIAMVAHFYGRTPALYWATGVVPAFAFIIVFTKIAMSANAARLRTLQMAAEVEKLTVVRERNRLAHEIHDSLGHYLTTIHVQLQAAQAVHASDPVRALEAVAKAQSLSREALVEVRRSVSALQVDAAQEPLTARLRELAALSNTCGIEVTLDVAGSDRPMRPEAEHAMFRAAQEALTNVRKHAQARTAAVRLDYTGSAVVRLEVVDDGRGAAEVPGDGHGLRGLRERFLGLGGRIETGNQDRGGFRLVAEVPV